jgi:D-arabinose 1-dehydrogenase-like Zn-dependent alcohol dehydrogenase
VTMMKVAVVPRAGAPFRIEQRDVPQPQAGQVLIKVQACGICHSDAFTRAGGWPGIEYPRVPGHEIAGVVEALGAGVTEWKKGQRVGVGWYGGHCGVCKACRAGDFVLCERGQVPGISYDGGYAEYMIAPRETLAAIPDDLKDVDAAPLLCAGITTFNALRHSGATAGDVVAILGIGGLGHLGVQYAVKMGYRTVAIARGEDKAKLAMELGAHEYVDSTRQDPAAALQLLGGARVILATATSGAAMTVVLGGLGRNGKMIIVGVSQDPVEVPTALMVMHRGSVQGWPSGTANDSADTLAFSALSGVRPMIEEFPLDRAEEAYQRMMSGHARFRVVLKM